ncbi:hypothetical protein WDW37_09225 [Bdellovibrionota bacterium FG-1]
MAESLRRTAQLSQEEADLERRDSLDSLKAVIELEGNERAAALLEMLQEHALRAGVKCAPSVQTPYVNTISIERQTTYPGDLAIERRITNLVRWNAMAMVVKASVDFLFIDPDPEIYHALIP